MSFRGVEFALTASIALQALVAQTPRPRADLATSLAQPPIPGDPLELVSGDAQPVQDAASRAAAISLLNKARAHSNVRAYAYDLKTTFVSPGASGGSWNLEDTSPARDIYRWTAQGGAYSTINLRTSELVYSNQPSGVIPLRLAQARTAIFYMYPQVGPYASVRTATATLNGAEVTCVLVMQMAQGTPSAGPRRWEESESCVDPKSNLWMTYSPVPGMYTAYDYTDALHFHDKLIPAKFTITEARQTVVEAHTQSVTNAESPTAAIFQPVGLEKIGVGPLMSTPWRVRNRSASGAVTSNSKLQVVVLDGIVNPQGQLSDVQVLASSDAGLDQSALDQASAWKNWQDQQDAQPGAAPQSHEVFFTIEFVT